MAKDDPQNSQQDYFGMCGLIQKHYRDECYDTDVTSMVPWETVAAIFWEETQFANVRQNGFNHQDWAKGPGSEKGKGNHAVGFGQVERETIILMQTQAKTTGALKGFFDGTPLATNDISSMAPGWWQTVDNLVLSDTRRAIHLTWHALIHQRKNHPNANLEKLLHNYGGLRDASGAPTDKMVRVARGWQATTSLLVNFRNSGLNANDYGGFVRAKRIIAAIFSCSRRNAQFMPTFGVESRQIHGYMYSGTDLFALGDGLACLSCGGSLQPGTNGNLGSDYRDFIAEYKQHKETDYQWIRPWIHKRYPNLKGLLLNIGPNGDE